MSMQTEFAAIISCRAMFVAFQPHRFVVNLGYSVNSSQMSSTTVIVTSVGVELLFEGIVDAFALHVESKHGV